MRCQLSLQPKPCCLDLKLKLEFQFGSSPLSIRIFTLTRFVRVLQNLKGPKMFLWHFPKRGKPFKKATGPRKVLEICKTRLTKMHRMEGSKEN